MELKYDPNAKLLTEAEIYKVIPKQFTIVCHTINVIVKDWIVPNNPEKDSSFYGQWNDVKCTIEIARAVKVGNEVIPLTIEQIKNTFYHEMFHCFFFFGQVPQDEMIVQALANFMREFEITKK